SPATSSTTRTPCPCACARAAASRWSRSAPPPRTWASSSAATAATSTPSAPWCAPPGCATASGFRSTSAETRHLISDPVKTTPPTTTPRRLRAAYVRRPHGVRGELRIEPLGGDASRFRAGLRLWSERDPGVAYTLVTARPASDGDLLISLGEVVSRNDAERLRGGYLCVDGDERRRLGE